MTNNELRLKQVLANVFDEESESINDESSMDTIENWDSLGHLKILLALDKNLNGKAANIAELGTAFSVKEILSILKKNHLISY